MTTHEPAAQGETFTKDQVEHAIRAFLEFGEQSFKEPIQQRGYFSGGGWAARCLRWHLEQLELPPPPPGATQP